MVKKASTKANKKANVKKRIKTTTKKLSTKSKTSTTMKVRSKNMNKVKSSKKGNNDNSGNTLKWIIGIVVAIVVIVAIALFVNKNAKPSETTYNTIEELNQNVKSGFVKPADSVGNEYTLEKGGIARMDYEKPYGGGHNLKYSLRSSDNEEDLKLDGTWGTKIVMTVNCKDGSEVEVESYVSTENVGVMKANWFDNDKYYLMTTDNLVTREDFLQEVNRVVIANHEEF